MKRRILIILAYIVLAAVLVMAIAVLSHSIKYGLVLVDRNIIWDIHVSSYKGTNGTIVKIPFLTLLEQLGYERTQQDEQLIMLEKNGKCFVVDIEELTLQENGTGMNYFLTPPGSSQHYCQREGNDVVLDMVGFDVVLGLMGDEHYILGIPALKIVIVDKIFRIN